MIGYLPNHYFGIYNDAAEVEEPFHTVEEAVEYYKNKYPEYTEICGDDSWIGVDKVDIDDGYVRILNTVRRPRYRFWLGDNDDVYAGAVESGSEFMVMFTQEPSNKKSN